VFLKYFVLYVLMK